MAYSDTTLKITCRPRRRRVVAVSRASFVLPKIRTFYIKSPQTILRSKKAQHGAVRAAMEGSW